MGILIILLGIGIFIPIFFLDIEDKIITVKKRLMSIFFMLTMFALFMLAYSNMVKKELCDKPNPYHKEYVYKQLPSGQYVKTDSVYVKTKKK